MSENYTPSDPTPETTPLFEQFEQDFQSTDELIVRGEQYTESMTGYFDSLNRMTSERTLASCYATLDQIDYSSAFFKCYAREIVIELEGEKRADALVARLAELQATCVKAVNAPHQTKFQEGVHPTQLAMTKAKLLKLDDGGNLPICTEAAKIHADIQKYHAFFHASELGLGKQFRAARMAPAAGKVATGAIGIIGKLRK